MPSSLTARSTTRRPLVILLGWLGSQPRFLRRYEKLYQRLLGQDTVVVLTRIASPSLVVQAVLSESNVISIPPGGWPAALDCECRSEKGQQTPGSIQKMAWGILRTLHHRHGDCTEFFVHAFSNGGCFVWEKIRQILLLDPLCDQQLDEGTSESLIALRKKLAGVIFDSCPIAELDRISDALAHCSWIERADVVRNCGLSYRYIGTDPALQQKVKRRAHSYIEGLCSDPLRIPQLYLYSRDDPLSPYILIKHIVEKRKEFLGSDIIMENLWDKSKHCQHLLEHPREYTDAVSHFVMVCESELLRSRL